MSIGYMTLVIHNHLPFQLKDRDDFAFIPFTEGFLATLKALYDLREENCPYQVSYSITPLLLEQLAKPYLADNFKDFLKEKLSALEQIEGKNLKPLAEFYTNYYNCLGDFFFKTLDCQPLNLLKDLEEQKYIEILTSPASNAYLPLLKRDSTLNGQLRIALSSHQQHLGSYPKGIWLPGGGYRNGFSTKDSYKPGLDEFISRSGLKYFIIDTYAVNEGKIFTPYSLGGDDVYTITKVREDGRLVRQNALSIKFPSTYLPYTLLSSGVYILGRNERINAQIWSSQSGFWTKPSYRNSRFLENKSQLPFWRGFYNSQDENLYDPEEGFEQAQEDANRFNSLVKDLLARFYQINRQRGVIVVPFLTDFLGYQWFEGPSWLKEFIKMVCDNDSLTLLGAWDYLENFPPKTVIEVPDCSWGEVRKHDTWYNTKTEQFWLAIWQSEELMEQIVEKFYHTEDESIKRMLNQAGREFLLMQNSDWISLLANDWYKQRVILEFNKHRRNFYKLAKPLSEDKINQETLNLLTDLEQENDFFPKLDYHYFTRCEPVSNEYLKYLNDDDYCLIADSFN